MPWRVLAAALLALTLAGCARSADTSKELESLRREPLASTTFDGLHLLREHEQDAKSSAESVTGKMVDAKITQVFEPDDAQLLAEHLGQVVSEAGTNRLPQPPASPAARNSMTSRRSCGMIAPCEDETCLFLYLSQQ